MKTEAFSTVLTRALATCRAATARRTFLEALLGYAVWLAAAAALEIVSGAAAALCTVSAVFWLTCWPVWRMGPWTGRWVVRVGLGAGRALVFGLALAVVPTLEPITVLPAAASWYGRGLGVAVFVLFLLSRAATAVYCALAERIATRLRWQIMMSHVAAIVLIVISLTSTGSVIGIVLIERGVTPDPRAMATSVADDIALASAPAAPGRVDKVLTEVYDTTLPLRGEPAFARIAPVSFRPRAIVLLDSGGRVLGGRAAIPGRDKATSRITTRAAVPWLSPTVWRQLQAALVGGREASLLVGSRSTGDPASTVAAAEVPGADNDVVVLMAPSVRLTSSQYLRAAATVFGVSTVGVIVLISIPTLVLSFLSSYLVARGMTNRLEGVSRVAAAIAAGNFSDRAPASGSDEVGRLAHDINEMADQLQASVTELETAHSRAIDALRLRRELVANVSHELRTPLAVMRANLEAEPVVARAGAMGAGSHDTLLQAMRTETARLEALVDDLFALSRAETEEIEVRREPIDVRPIIEEVVALMAPLTHREGAIALVSDAPADIPAAQGDAERLRQILSNLVRNAARHTPEGGIIAVTAASRESMVAIAVADTGEGIAPEHLPHIFERFYRGDPAPGRAGAGLGLAIVRELIDRMGGRVEVESTIGVGTRFTVLLPRA